MKLKIYSLEFCPYSIKSENMLKLYKPEIIKVKQTEKQNYKNLNNMMTFPQIFLEHSNGKIKIGGLDDTINLLNYIFKINTNYDIKKYNTNDFDILNKFFTNT